MSYNNPINQSNQEIEKAKQGKLDDDMIDAMDDATAYMEIIKENIEYEHHMKYGDWSEKGLYEELYEVICEIMCVKRRTVKVNGEDYPYELVKSKFLKLNSSHLEYVIGCMKETTTKITNIRAYMVTALYNAPNTMNHYYQQLVQHGKERMLSDSPRGRISIKEKLAEMRQKAYGQKMPEKPEISKGKGKEESL